MFPFCFLCCNVLVDVEQGKDTSTAVVEKNTSVLTEYDTKTGAKQNSAEKPTKDVPTVDVVESPSAMKLAKPKSAAMAESKIKAIAKSLQDFKEELQDVIGSAQSLVGIINENPKMEMGKLTTSMRRYKKHLVRQKRPARTPSYAPPMTMEANVFFSLNMSRITLRRNSPAKVFFGSIVLS